jgi:hypothetical protein
VLVLCDGKNFIPGQSAHGDAVSRRNHVGCP